MIYLAQPYTNFALGRDSAFKEAAKITAALIRRGYHVFSPIAYGHPLCQHGGLPEVDIELWERVDRPFLEMCDRCFVAKLPGWLTSAGVQAEIAYFLSRDLPVFFLDPKTFELAPALERRGRNGERLFPREVVA